jgi:hypothetical protein
MAVASAPHPPADDCSGPFDPAWRLDRLSRAALARLGREVMLVSMLHDRSLMPHVATRGGTTESVQLADDEWMCASPIYTARNRAALGIDGTGAGDILKSFQFDIGMPHQFLDFHGEVVGPDLAYFWLPYCGAHDYVRFVSGNDEGVVRMMCHQMEDNTFDATLKATNPRARCLPVHRPPKPDVIEGEHCRWEVRILDGDQPARDDNPNLPVMRATAAASFTHTLGPDHQPGGLPDYAGPFVPGLRLEDLAHGVLVRQVKEFALDVHLLMRAAYLSVERRHGADVLATAAVEHIAALAPPLVQRLTEAMAITGDGADAIAKVLQLNPLLPPDYVTTTVEVIDARTVRVSVSGEGLDDRATPSPLDLLADDRPALLHELARAVNPRVRTTRVSAHEPVWLVTIDPALDPEPEHPLAAIVGAHNFLDADMTPRPVPVALRT